MGRYSAASFGQCTPAPLKRIYAPPSASPLTDQRPHTHTERLRNGDQLIGHDVAVLPLNPGDRSLIDQQLLELRCSRKLGLLGLAKGL
jgi:hypothetical protein